MSEQTDPKGGETFIFEVGDYGDGGINHVSQSGKNYCASDELGIQRDKC